MKRFQSFSWSVLSGELRRREVYPVIVAYAVIGWILLQIGEVTLAPLGFPDWVMTALVVMVIAGFPVTLFLAWRYDITPRGIRVDRGPVPEAQGGRPSIAVLPFADMSPDKDQRYFCEGIAEEILNALTGIRQLKVAARSSSFQFQSEAGDVREIGRQLDVKAILEGSVRKSGDQLRVTAQLVKVSDGYHLWSKTFDQQLENIFAIQDDIASSIAQSLLETINPDERAAIRTTSSANVNAYDLYLRGRQYFKRFGKMDIEHARQIFWQAIELDPDFALAWAGYADCHSILIMYADPNPAYAQQANQASERALALQPDLAEAHASRGLACLVCREFNDAEVEFVRALELNPGLYNAWYFYGRTRFHQGDLEMAADLFRRAAEADPADYQARLLRVQILRGTGQTELAEVEAAEAIAAVEKHMEWSPDDARAFHLGAGSLIVLGQLDKAKRWMRRGLELDPDDSIALYNTACNFATMNEVEESLRYLEKAIDRGIVSADWMRSDADLVNLRTNPRFKVLVGRVDERERQKAEGGEEC
jgi:TolB-like protein/Flp pilus assembly protein TadD